MINKIDYLIQLSSNSIIGKQSLDNEKIIIDLMSAKWDKYNLKFIETDKRKASRVDYIIAKDNQLAGLVEIKCRDITYNKLVNEYDNKAMITLNKYNDGITLSKLLCVPFIVVNYFIPDSIILYWKVTDSYNKELIPIEIRRFETPASCVGGKAMRDNVFLDIKYSKVLLDKYNLLNRNDT